MPLRENVKIGGEATDLFFLGGTVVSVYSGELLKANVAIDGERFHYVGRFTNFIGSSTKVVDVTGKFLVPGYIDPHFHPWFIYNPISFGEQTCRTGVTTLFCDNLLFYLLMGPGLFETFMNAFSKMPIKYYWFCRIVPQTPMKEEEELFSVDNLRKVLRSPWAKSIGEITRWPEVIKGNRKMEELIRFAKEELNKRVDGHTAGARYDQLAILSRCGIESCHEAINAQEALDRLRVGMYVILRESSLRQDLRELLKIVTENRVLTDRLMLTTDSSSPAFYDEVGFTEHILKIAIDVGIDPIQVYKMVTITPAVYYGMDHELGGIAPGRFADMVVLNDLRDPRPEMVVSKGRILAEKGDLKEAFPLLDWDRFLPQDSFCRGQWRLDPMMLRIKSKKKSLRFPVISLISPVITRLEWTEVDVKSGTVVLPEGSQYCFVSLVNREGKWLVNGILKGYGKVEGFASSFNTAAQVLAIGQSARAMAAAVNRVLELKGGVVAFEGGKVAYEMPLPLGGVMSEKPMGYLAEKERELKGFLNERGYPFHDPLYTLVFLPNDFLPEVRINYQGIVNIKTNEVLYPRVDLCR